VARGRFENDRLTGVEEIFVAVTRGAGHYGLDSSTEHGPQGGDELNVIRAGANYGWPVIGFGLNYRNGAAIHSGTHREGMEQPTHIWVPSIGVSGLLVYTGDKFPERRGNIFAGGMVGEQ